WDGEMSPRLQLTAVPYAFRAGMLATNTGTFASTLNFVQPTGGNQIFNIPDQGAAGTYSLLTTTAANAGYIQLQGSTPGTAQTGNFNITGTGIAGALQAPSIDAISSGGTLALGGTNSGTGAVNIASGATTGTVTIGGSTQTGSIQIGVGTGVQTLNLGTGGTGAKTITIGSTASSSSTAIQCGTGSCTIGANAVAHTTTVGSVTGAAVTNIQGGTGSTAINLTAGTNGTINATASGSGKIKLMSDQSIIAQSTTNNNIAFQVQNSSGGYILNVDTQNTVIGLALLNTGIYSSTGGYLDTYYAGAGIAIGNTNAGSVVIGNTSTGTTVNVQGGAGASAISLAPATNGSITETTTGTGTITLSTANSVIAKSTTDSTSAFQIQNASGATLLNYSTSDGALTTYGDSLTVNGVANPAAPSLTSVGTGGSLAANTYFYRIDAVGTDGSSTTAGIPSSPGSVTTTGTTSKNTLTWTAVPYATNYDIYRSIDGGNNWFSNRVSSATTSIVDDGTTYTWTTSDSFSNLSNAGGINLQRGTGVTFDAGSGGTYRMQIFDNVNGGETLTMGNYNSGGAIDIQAQNFYVTDTNTFTHDFSMSGSTGSATFTNNTNSSTAFTIQSSGAVNYFTADTTHERIIIGPSGGDATGALLILGNKTGSSADPTEVDGAMYYNATSRTFRCGLNSVWRSCIGGLVNSSKSASTAIAATVTKTNFTGGTNNSYTTLANDCQPGVVYNVTAQGVYSNSTTASTLTFALTVDGTATNLVASGAIPTTASASNAGWQVTAQLICDTTGTSGTVEVQGVAVVSSNTAGAGTSAATGVMANSATQTLNTTTTHSLALAVTWGASTSGNTIAMRQFIVQRLGP
ncbi:MAG TPA: hypothetical protein VLG16_04530, partial [Candidatus Saccharimonadales bacterium]|nr:hypothetical protein [Candidatus Saccharimonadales bacterium]